MSEPLLKVENVAASYGSIVALKSVSLEVYEGEIVTIVGANGAGKTTLLSCISGLMPYKGSIAFKGERKNRQRRDRGAWRDSGPGRPPDLQ